MTQRDPESPPAARLQRSLDTILQRSAVAGGNREAVRIGDQTLDFRSLREHSLRIANALRGLGIERGDRVAVLLRNSLEWVETFLGIAEAGAICVPVNVLLRPVEVAALCDDADVRAFVVDEGGLEAYEQLPRRPELLIYATRTPLGNRGGDAVPFATLYEGAPRSVADGAGLDDNLVFYYTSGTTGLPKGSVHTHDGVLWNSYHQILDLGVTRDEVYLVVPSLSWAAGFQDVMLAALWAGGRSVLMPTGGTTMDRIVDNVEQHGVTRALIVPTLLKQLLNDTATLDRLRRSTLRYVLTGAEPVPLPVIEGLVEALPGCSIQQGYGLSEFPTIASVLLPEEAASHVGSAGRPNSITCMAVMTESGSIDDFGTGEVLLRSPATMHAYWRRPEETAAAFADGWLHTGDTGSIDEQGFLTITGRKKDMIISGGLNVYPSEIEAVIYSFPGVREAAVVGVPDPRWGEAAVAIVVTDGPFDAAGLLEHCRTRLAGYKQPRHVLVRAAALPRNPIGKLLKRELRPWAQRRLERS